MNYEETIQNQFTTKDHTDSRFILRGGSHYARSDTYLHWR